MANLIDRKKYKFIIPDGQAKERIDVYLANKIENATRNRIQRLIKNRLVLVNDIIVKANYCVNPYDEIKVEIPIAPRPEDVEAEDIPLDIIYEDSDLLVVNKPAGMVAHPAYSNYTGTLVNALLHHTQKLSDINEVGRPGIVHRIDKDTSGLLVVAKNDYIHAKLAEQFAAHTIDREYWAVCWGLFNHTKGEINANIVRSKSDRKKFTVGKDDEGKTALTYYEVLEEFEFCSLIKCYLKTGRTHQIRVHLSSVNHPIFGDPTYGGRVIVYGSNLPKIKSRVQNLLDLMPRQALHAKTLGFIHPSTGAKILLEAPLPEDFNLLLEKLK